MESFLHGSENLEQRAWTDDLSSVQKVQFFCELAGVEFGLTECSQYIYSTAITRNSSVSYSLLLRAAFSASTSTLLSIFFYSFQFMILELTIYRGWQVFDWLFEKASTFKQEVLIRTAWLRFLPLYGNSDSFYTVLLDLLRCQEEQASDFPRISSSFFFQWSYFALKTFLPRFFLTQCVKFHFRIGVIWAVAQVSWFIANKSLSFEVTFPVNSTGPGLVAALWVRLHVIFSAMFLCVHMTRVLLDREFSCLGRLKELETFWFCCLLSRLRARELPLWHFPKGPLRTTAHT